MFFYALADHGHFTLRHLIHNPQNHEHHAVPAVSRYSFL